MLGCLALACAPTAPPRDAAPADAARSVADASADAWVTVDTRFDAGECGLFDPDHDFIDSADEGRHDPDGDGLPSDHDDDADGDGVLDRDEAGDELCGTPPVSCAEEDPSDRLFDALDPDRDGDGLDDGAEIAAATEPCGVDTDGDGVSDLLEVAYSHWSCRAGDRSACACALDPDCAPPPDAMIVILPAGTPIERGLTLELPASTTRSMDVETRVLSLALDDGGIDAGIVVDDVGPACAVGATDCWAEPSDVAHEDAVLGMTATRFLGVVPGTRLDFTVALLDEVVSRGARSHVLGLRVTLVEVGTRDALDHRDVIVVLRSE